MASDAEKMNVDKMMEDVAARLAEAGHEMAGLSLEGLREAVSHPKAAAEIQRIFALEAGSVKQGDPAPDFRLPYLPGQGEGAVRLSERWAQRPVALIFGSYT